MLHRIMKQIVFLTFVLFINSFSQSVQNFIIENNTGTTIYDVYVAHVDDEEWSEDLLEESLLEDGESLEINFSGYGDDACLFDVMIGDLDGNYFQLSDVDLCTISTLTFTGDNEVAKEEIENSSDAQSLEDILTSLKWDTTYSGESYGTIKFNADGSVIKSSGMGDTNGSWKLDGDKLTIHFPEEGDAYDGTIKYVDGNIVANFMGIEWIYKPL